MNVKILNLKFLSILFASLFIFTGCTLTPKNPEEAIVKTFFTAMAEADVDTFFDSIYSAELDEATLTMMKPKFAEMLTMYKDEELASREGLKSIDIVEKEMAEDGLSGVISYIMTFGDGTTDEDIVPVINIDGQWKVNLDN